MAFNDQYKESIQNKHIGNVGFTSITKGITNEANSVKNPHQVLASQIPAVDVIGTYGPTIASGLTAGVVAYHDIVFTSDSTVSNNKSWYASVSGVRLDQWMRYEGTQYKLRLYEDDGSGGHGSEILPSEPNFNWEYNASAGIVYFDNNPGIYYIMPLHGTFLTYIGDTVEDRLSKESMYYDLDVTYVDEKLWKILGNYATIPNNFIVYVNGIKQRQGVDADVSSVYISSGDIYIAFNYNVVSNCWVSVTFVM